MFEFFKKRTRVLVIGSCHLDVMADFGRSGRAFQDKPGRIHFSVGGTAYNIAVNLAAAGSRVSILTVVKKDSVISDIIEFKLHRAGVRLSYLIKETIDAESGFIGHREDGDLVSAVTATLIEGYEIDRDFLNNAISRSDAVVMECNLTERQICTVASKCLEMGKPYFIAAVSDAKARRLLAASNITDIGAASLVAMNAAEAAQLDIEPAKLKTDTALRQSFLDRLRSRAACVTFGADGLIRFSLDGGFDFFPAPKVAEVVSASGAGDAVFSAMIECELAGKTQPGQIKSQVYRRVAAVLGSESSNIGGMAKTEQFLALKRNRPIIIRIGENAILFNYVSLVIAVVSLAVGIVGALGINWR
jgi:sugar/nucleoside kinase (ribokinase family)